MKSVRRHLKFTQKRKHKKTLLSCCKSSKRSKKCIRKSDGKVFALPRRFTRKRCIRGPIKGFTMRSSCSPFQSCN